MIDRRKASISLRGDVEMVRGDVGGEHDLGRQLRLAGRVEVAEPDQQARRPGERPLQAAARQCDRHVHPLQPCVLDQEVGCLFDLVTDRGGDDGRT